MCCIVSGSHIDYLPFSFLVLEWKRFLKSCNFFFELVVAGATPAASYEVRYIYFSSAYFVARLHLQWRDHHYIITMKGNWSIVIERAS